jgi:hypothetical protein
MATSRHADEPGPDLLTRPLIAVLLWGLPLAAGWTANALLPTGPWADVVWAIALAWMGAGCVINARSCHRLHCYLAAPVLFLGAIGVAVVAFGLAPFGAHTASLVINTSLGLALLTFAAEPIWGRYRRG